MYTLTTSTKKLLKLRKRIRAVAGGTSAGKTISILQLLIDDAQSDNKPTLTSIVAESFPHLRRGAMRDFLNIMKDHGYFKEDRWSKSEHTYTFETGSRIEFFSADQPSKVRGPRRDRLFVNEGNNIDKESWEQLLLRTKEYAWIDWNPVSEFYMYEEYIDKRPDVDFIILTYLDNEGLSKEIVSEIESRKGNKNWWRVYGEGLLGEVESRIYKDWAIIEEVPHTAKLIVRGLDFGYSQDPAALVDIYYHDGGYIFDEQLYQKGMTNDAIARFIQNLNEPNMLVIADSAEPKSIDEIKMYGINILPTTKGPGSLNQRIQFLQGKRISVTNRSVNGIKEYRSYLWKTDRDGRILAVPEGGNDHFLDAAGYGLASQDKPNDVHAYKPQSMLQRKYHRAKN
jgi:phage terminase large subunit